MPQFFQLSSYAPTSYYSTEYASSYSSSFVRASSITHGGGSESSSHSGQTFITRNQTRTQDAYQESASRAGMSSIPRAISYAYISRCYVPQDCEDPQPIPSEQFYGVFEASWVDSGTYSYSSSAQVINVAQVSAKEFEN